MARKKTQVEYSNFTGGFITEASPMTFPENASLDEQNVNINRDGSRQRRFGLDWTDDAHVVALADNLTTFDYGVSAYTWRSVANNGNDNFAVCQRGRIAYVFDIDAVDPTSTLVGTIDLSAVTVVPALTNVWSMSQAYGDLIIAPGTQYAYRVSWNGAAFTVNEFRLEVRDIWGLDDGWAVDQRIGALTNSHHYNLRNQGWPANFTNTDYSAFPTVSGTLYTDPVVQTNKWLGPLGLNIGTGTAVYPSNADLIWAAKYGAGTPVTAINAYHALELTKTPFGTTPAPRGHYLIDLFNRGAGRIAASGFGGLATDSTAGTVQTVSSYAGRVWYSVTDRGVTSGDSLSPFIGNMVFYSQAKSDLAKTGFCFTENDPTAEDISDVLETDGGFIQITEAGEILRMAPLGESLVVLSANGVWEIFGGDTGFSATVQSVVKITNRGALSYQSIVVGETSIAYWSESGIYLLRVDPTTLRISAVNITEQTIQTYYDDIPLALKKQAVGEYDTISKQAVWLYNLETPQSRFYFQHELVFDGLKGSFTKRKFVPSETTGTGPYPIVPVPLQTLLPTITEEAVTAAGVPVTALGVPVTAKISAAEQKNKTALMYWTAHSSDGVAEDYRLGGYLDFNFIDWPDIDGGSDAEAFLLTGYLTGGVSSRDKWAPYITVNSKRTESDWVEDALGNVTVTGESSCTMQAQWEWTNNILSGRWSNPQEVYRLPRFFLISPDHIFSYDVVSTRNKLRGKGKALSLKFTSSPGKDMFLIGWGIDVEVNENA